MVSDPKHTTLVIYDRRTSRVVRFRRNWKLGQAPVFSSLMPRECPAFYGWFIVQSGVNVKPGDPITNFGFPREPKLDPLEANIIPLGV